VHKKLNLKKQYQFSLFLAGAGGQEIIPGPEIDINFQVIKKTPRYLLRKVRKPGYIDPSQYPHVFVNPLHKKPEAEFNQPKYGVTESGVRYRFTAKENHL